MGEPKIPGGGLKDPPSPDVGEGGGSLGPAGAILVSGNKRGGGGKDGGTTTGVSGGGGSDSGGTIQALNDTKVQCPKGTACDTSPYELRDPDSIGTGADPDGPPPSYGSPCVPGRGGTIAKCAPTSNP
jgi:hypothetical protein